MSDFAAELMELGMTEAELDAALAEEVPRTQLAALWEPDDQMISRVTARAEKRLADREALRATIDLCGLGWFTLRAIFGDQQETHGH